jgi:hypothetical protein
MDTLAARFPVAHRPHPLLLVHRIEPELARRLRAAAALYVSRCLPGRRTFGPDDEEALLAALVAHADAIPNLTPNGMLVPKRHTILEYNLLVRAIADVVSALDIADRIQSWHVPANLRVKFPAPSAENLARHHPTEHVHSDSWAGESSESVTLHLPIFGDLERNHVRFFSPPADFAEEWLRPLPTYAAGADVAARYGTLDFVPAKGEAILADFAMLHASHRLPGAGPRVSVDTTFALRRTASHVEAERIHPWRENERASHGVLAGIGETHLLLFPDSVGTQVDSQGGFKHPTTLRLVELLGDTTTA